LLASAYQENGSVDQSVKTIAFWLVLILSAFLLWQVVKSGNAPAQTPEISYSEFLSQVDSGNVSTVAITKNRVTGTYHDNRTFRVVVPSSQEGMLQNLRQKNVEIWFKDSGADAGWPSWMLNLAPLILLAAVWFFMIRQMQQKKVQM
jgi:cell division protease FtsH